MLDDILPPELVDKIYFEVHKMKMSISFAVIDKYVPKPESSTQSVFTDYLVMYRPTYYVSARLTYKDCFFHRLNNDEPSQIEQKCLMYVISMRYKQNSFT